MPFSPWTRDSTGFTALIGGVSYVLQRQPPKPYPSPAPWDVYAGGAYLDTVPTLADAKAAALTHAAERRQAVRATQVKRRTA